MNKLFMVVLNLFIYSLVNYLIYLFHFETDNIPSPYSGWGPKRPPYQFFPCNFYKLKNKPPKLWLLVLFPLPHLRKISRSYLVPVLSYWTWTNRIPKKNRFFWSNTSKIEVMKTSLIEMLELPHFGHMVTSAM